MLLRTTALLTGLALASSSLAYASERWRAASFEDFSKGEQENTVLTSQGQLRLGQEATLVAMPSGVEASLVWSSLEMSDGSVFLGTGNKGTLLKYAGGKLSKAAQTDAMVLTALADAGNGAVYAGSMPGGKIFKIDAAGAVTTFADLEAEQVWALVKSGNTLYAATGPNGVLYAIDASGKAKVVYDSAEEHLLSLTAAADGNLLAGTSKNGLLLRITPEGKATALWDFEEQEIKAIRVQGSDTFVLANTVASSDSKESKKGGALYRLDKDGRIESVYQNKDTYFTDVELAKDGAYLSSGTDGKIYWVDTANLTVQVAFDAVERQVLQLHLTGKNPFFTCGDAAAVYQVSTGLSKKASYTSKVIDAKYMASFGALYFSGQGKLGVRTRSGNTATPDSTWSDWSAPESSSGFQVKSPKGRYLQVKVEWGSDANATLSRLDVYYQTQNQRHVVTEVKVDGEESTDARSSKESTELGKRRISWKTENPDGDVLSTWLWYKAENESNWKALAEGKRLDAKTEYTWETSSVPDGYYQVKVMVSDSTDHPAEEVVSSEKWSAPTLVDNSKPSFAAELSIASGKVKGTAEDAFSPLRRIEYSIDGGEWVLVGAADGIFDSRREGFAFSLPTSLAAGSHTLSLRAVDAAGNFGLTRKQFEAGK